MTATASTTTNRIDKTPAFLIAHTIRYVSRGRLLEKVRFATEGATTIQRTDSIQPEIELNDASIKFRGERSSETETGSEQRRTH
jgi:hypothetical protein